MNTQNPNTRKKRAGILSLVLIALLLLSGTYAWQYNQHKTTEATADNDAILKSVQLVDESQNTDSWTTGAALDKKLYVKNDGADGNSGTPRFENVYVRIELKEYMECKNVGQEVYPNRLMIDTSGDFVSYDSESDALADYPNNTPVKLTNALGGAPTAEKWFVETAKGDPNGQYGNFMTTKVTNEQLYITGGAWTAGSAKANVADDSYHTSGETEECDYTAIDWEDAAADYTDSANYANANTQLFRQYVELALDVDVEFLSDYADPTTIAQGAYWLIDDVTDKTYAYWMQPLAPQAATKLFTESMELIESPNGQYDDGSGNMVDYPLNFYYALHADLDPTLKADYAQDWSGMNTDIQDVLFPPPLPNYFRIAFFDENSPSTPKGGTVIPRITENPQNATLEYSINGGKKWISFANNDNINVTAGDGGEILFRGTNRTSLRDNFSTKNSADKKWTITPESGGKTKVAGNIMLLLDYNIPPAAVGRGGFMYMFDGCTSLVDASKLELPATTLDEGRNYAFMFQNCTSLVSAPELPATTLSEECYTSMFEGCTSLVNGPSVLPANTIEDYSCEKMFAGCRLLEKAPDLLATSVNNGGCYQMFKGCIGLVQGPSELSATEVGELGYDSMFYGCTALEDAPPILATRWYSYGDPFVSMFSGCTSLKSITVSFTTWPDEQDEIKNWVWGVQTQSGTFTYPTGLQVEYGTSRIPQNWTLNPQ